MLPPFCDNSSGARINILKYGLSIDNEQIIIIYFKNDKTNEFENV